MTTLPFAPLTHNELNARTTAALEGAGWTAANAVRDGRTFDEWDLARLAEYGAAANMWHRAAMARMGAR